MSCCVAGCAATLARCRPGSAYPQPVPEPVTLTDRRVALRGAAAVLAIPLLAAGCDATDTTTPRNGRVRPTAGSANADQDLVASVAGRVAGVRAAATRLAQHDHTHRSWALGLASLHQRHLHRLGTGWAAKPVKAQTAAALVAAERQLQQSLVSAAERAESGSLAQVLASMAAAVGQRLVNA